MIILINNHFDQKEYVDVAMQAGMNHEHGCFEIRATEESGRLRMKANISRKCYILECTRMHIVRDIKPPSRIHFRVNRPS